MFILRKLIEKDRNNKMGEQGLEFYICSLSCTTIVYKVGKGPNLVYLHDWLRLSQMLHMYSK